VVYWGQNSYGASHPNAPTEWEKSLGEYCDDVSIDMIIISFLYNFNIHNDQALPELNLSYHCNTTFVEHPSLLKCPNIEKDIIYCQSKNKRILLSLGGASGTYGFTNLNQISTFTKTIWDSYLGGNGKYRPFGSAILDGIDLDIEGGSDLGYAELVHSFREYYVRSTNKRYIIAAAPQCVFPDAFLGKAFMQAHFDYIFIQFYNNYCGVNNMNQFNYDQWHQWAIKNSINPNVKLYLGVPGSVNAANQGYLNPVSLIEILDKLKKYTSFAGVMIWDASQS
ncbi:chitinase, partial [Neoconidiobolus thromboides FSU 785]